MAQTRIAALAALLAFAALPALVAPPVHQAHAREPSIYTGIVKGVAVGGYDAVAYHTQGKPVPGTIAHTLEHGGATWRFASAENRDLFKADPAKYAPQYGGYCAYAVSQGYTAKGDPEAWSIRDGKLYLNYNKSVRKDWEKNATQFIKAGDANWPKLAGPQS